MINDTFLIAILFPLGASFGAIMVYITTRALHTYLDESRQRAWDAYDILVSETHDAELERLTKKLK